MASPSPIATAERPAAIATAREAKPWKPTNRIAAIDWMRGLVMVLMIIDHASMAFDRHHLSQDSAMYPEAATMALPAGEFFTRWMTHICAPTFVLLAGVALALSVERRAAKGMAARDIDRFIITRGAIIALLDLTVVSFGSGRWNMGVLFAIGVSMICMAGLRRLPTGALVAIGLGWFAFGELLTDWVWDPPGSSSPMAAILIANYASENLLIKYPVIPWLAIMVLGWALGRHANNFQAGKARVSAQKVLWIAGAAALVVFVIVRASQGYGDMFLNRMDNSWQQWLHVSKYPPSLSYVTLELGLMSLCLAGLARIEPRIGVRPNGVFLVFGQTAMFFYLVHRLAFEIPATYFGLRGVGGLATTYWVAALMLVLLYPACRWYRTVKAAHPESFLKYI
jgi:uncharacterized membrane protein